MKVVGHYHALWVLVPVNLTEIQDELPSLGQYEWKYPAWIKENLPEGKVFVWLELGKQSDCGPALSSWMRSSFFEAKVNLPFIQNPSEDDQMISVKGGVIMNNYVNSWGSQLVHSLHTKYCRGFAFTDTSYDIHFGQDKQVKLNFEPEGEFQTWTDLSSLPGQYESMCNLPWVGTLGTSFQDPHNHKLPLQPMLFDYESAKVRPIHGDLTISRDTLPFFPSGGEFTIHSIANRPTGALEVLIPWSM